MAMDRGQKTRGHTNGGKGMGIMPAKRQGDREQGTGGPGHRGQGTRGTGYIGQGTRGIRGRGQGDREQGTRRQGTGRQGTGDTGQRAVDMNMAEKVVHITHRARGHVATHRSVVIAIS